MKVVGRREPRAFSDVFKTEAVRLMHEGRAAGRSLAQIGRELDVRPEQLRWWAREHGDRSAAASQAAGETLEQENRRLRRELATLQQEQAFRRKSGGVLRERVAMRCAVIARHVGEFPVRLMCRVLRVSPAGFYAYQRRPEPWRARRVGAASVRQTRRTRTPSPRIGSVGSSPWTDGP
jgi:transposase-like protein